MPLERNITHLPALIEGLPAEEHVLVCRIFDVDAATGRLELPESMVPWVERTFGAADAVRAQRIVRVTNLVTLEGTLFNGLRASRPLDTGVSMDLDREVAATTGDPFCAPLDGTPADIFGRVRGKHSITASNVAKYDGFHGVIVFDEHNPLRLKPEKVADYISVGLEWCRRANEADPEARYPFLMWNCLWRAGGSIIHGHAQATVTRRMHYPEVERLRRAAGAYRARHGSDYFSDLHRIHEALGLSVSTPGVRCFASLTPVKEKELIIMGEDAGNEAFVHAIARVLAAYVGRFGVRSFNVAFQIPPLLPVTEDWSEFPAIVRVVDRGDPGNRTSDIGAMELYAAPVVASDPFRVAAALSAAIA